MSEQADPFFDLDDVRDLVAKWAIDCGRRVSKRRETLGWDRRQLAGITGTTEATIHRIESGALRPRDHLKLAIAAALQLEVEDLWPYPSRATVYEVASVA